MVFGLGSRTDRGQTAFCRLMPGQKAGWSRDRVWIRAHGNNYEIDYMGRILARIRGFFDPGGASPPPLRASAAGIRPRRPFPPVTCTPGLHMCVSAGAVAAVSAGVPKAVFGPGSGGFLIRAACRFWPSAARMFASPAGSESRVLRVKCAFASMRQTTSAGAGGFPVPDQKTPESGTAAVGACRNPARPPTPVVPAGGVADSLACRMGTVHLPRSGIDMPAAPPGVASTPARVRT